MRRAAALAAALTLTACDSWTVTTAAELKAAIESIPSGQTRVIHVAATIDEPVRAFLPETRDPVAALIRCDMGTGFAWDPDGPWNPALAPNATNAVKVQTQAGTAPGWTVDVEGCDLTQAPGATSTAQGFSIASNDDIVGAFSYRKGRASVPTTGSSSIALGVNPNSPTRQTFADLTVWAHICFDGKSDLGIRKPLTLFGVTCWAHASAGGAAPRLVKLQGDQELRATNSVSVDGMIQHAGRDTQPGRHELAGFTFVVTPAYAEGALINDASVHPQTWVLDDVTVRCEGGATLPPHGVYRNASGSGGQVVGTPKLEEC